MKIADCYLYGHKWRITSFVEHADGAKYTLSRCIKCGAEQRIYENGYVEQAYSEDWNDTEGSNYKTYMM
ncbi:MAG: hypothetical protein JW786_00145 [Desulfobacterales bacterium]|nr:hypothetical protein [Desulfobacterales bacterium]